MTAVTDATFQSQVVDRSKTVPVVVDLWAEWCEPCKQLTPILQRVVASTNGGVELVTVDIEKNPGIAQAFKVQSIPAVYAMVNGAVADGFLGAQNEATVTEFIKRLVPNAPPTELEQLTAAGDEASLRKALEISPDHVPAKLALAELLINDNMSAAVDNDISTVAGIEDDDIMNAGVDNDDNNNAGTAEAIALLDELPDSPEVRRLHSLIRLQSDGTGSATNTEAELEQLLTQVKDDEDARQRFIDLLELLDPHSAAEWRKRLSSALF